MRAAALPPIAIVGAGRLGRALRDALGGSARLVTRADARSGGLGRAVGAARWIVLAVPDHAIAAVAAELARGAASGWRGRVVLHAAGALGPEPLAALSALGAATGVLHPLAALPRPGSAGAGAFTGAGARIEGAPRAVRAARAIATRVGLRPLRLRAPRSGDERALYHAAASLVANDLVALLSLATDLLVRLGARRRDAERALTHLAATAARSVGEAGSLAGGLTGPVARGDVETIRRHLRALARRSGPAAEAHRVLSLRLVEIAAGAGRLDAEGAARLRRLLAAGRPGGPTV